MPRAFLFALAAMLALASCATLPDPLAGQRRVYEEKLKKIEPGMTRRQLYALLPPSGVPEVTPAGFSGTIAGVFFYNFHSERYPLYKDFSLLVFYRRMEVRRYLDRFYAACKKDKVSGLPMSPKNYPQIQFTKRPDMDDQLAACPVLMQHGVMPKRIFIPFEGPLEELATPPRKS